MLGKLPNEVKDLSYEECLFLLAVDEEYNSFKYKKQLEDLGSMLGTVFDVEEPKPSESNNNKQEKIVLPLSFAVGLSGMDGMKNIQKYLDKARANAKNHNIAFDSSEELTKEEFKSIFVRDGK